MIALKLFTSEDGSASWFDVLLGHGDLASDEGLEAAVLMSLFLDRAPEPEDLADVNDDQYKGWWGDALADQGDKTGSRLWVLNRSKALNSVVRRAKEYAEEALRWMVEDGVARRVTATARRINSSVLELKVDILRSDGRRWESAWEVQLNAV